MSRTTIAEVVLEHADGLESVVVVPTGDTAEIVAAGEVVAVLVPSGLEVRLRTAVAAAALRTPDVASSTRGGGWVRFAPPTVDDFARDRAIAWLESAVRFAAEGNA